MKRILSLSLFLILSICILSACKNVGGDTDPAPEGAIWDSEDSVYLITSDNIDQNQFSIDFNEASGLWVKISEDKSQRPTELIIGEYDRELSRTAYTKLKRLFSEESGKSMWLIYSDGSSVAIAYESLIARYAAIEYLFSNYGKLNFAVDGIVACEEFDAMKYAEAKREENRAEGFTALEGSISDSAIAALENLYDLYDAEVYMWLANLWDPDIGGFYYSESARDTNGFLPDIESTVQALSFLKNSGLVADYGNSYVEALSDEMKASLLAYAKGLQDPTDGYFYHPQWGKDVGISRRGRDLGWAVQLIVALGGQPYWDTPNGRDGELGAPGVSPASLTSRLGRSAVNAVSAVVPTSTLPEYLRSLDKFKAYLESLDWETNSYNAGNTLDAQMGQIGNAGTEYKNYLIKFLNERQYAHNGLWEEQTDYDSVNGLMKISGLYGSCKAIIPNAEAAMLSAMSIAMTPDGAAHVCSVYNPWVAMANTLESVESTEGIERANELRAMLRENAEQLIKITHTKLAIFKKDDGGFSYYPNNSATRSQGATVALAGARESDVNATGICTNGTISNMLEAMGFDDIPRFCPEDFAIFSDTLNSLGTILKDEIPPAEIITFDEYDSLSGAEVGGVVTYPHDYAENHVGDNDTDIDGNYKWFQSSVVQNPAKGASKSDLVLYSRAYTYSGTDKKQALSASSTWFNIANSGVGSSGNCFVYDADMYFASGSGVLCQLTFTGDYDESRPCASLNFETYTEGGVKYIKIGENYAGLDGLKDASIAVAIPMGEWVNIRIEFHKTYEDIEDPVTGLADTKYYPKLKVYVNGVYQGECDANITGGGKYYDRKITNVAVSYYRFNASEMYFNNVLVERTQAIYKEEQDPDPIIEVPIPNEPMRESYGFEDGLLNTSNVQNKVNYNYYGTSLYLNATEDQVYNPTVSYSIVNDPTGAANKALKVAVKKTTDYAASRTEVHLYNPKAQGTTYTFTGDFYYDSSTIGFASDLTQIFFMNTSDKSNYSLRIAARKLGGVYVLSLIEYNTKNDEGDTGTGKVIYENIPCDAWFNLRIDFHKTLDGATTSAKFYINGKEVFDDFSFKNAALNDTALEKVNITHQRTNSGTLYLDDLSFVKSSLEFVPMPEPEPVADFESEILGGDYLDNYISALDSDGGAVLLNAKNVENMDAYSAYTTYYLADDPTGAANKVLKVVKVKNANASSSSTVVKLSASEENASCYVFETKLYIESIGGYDVMRITIGNDSYSLVSFRFYVESGKVTIKQNNGGTGGTGTGNVTDYSESVVTVPKSAWCNLKVEFYKTNSADTTMCKIYLAASGEELLPVAELSAYTVYGLNSAYTPSKTTIEHYNKGNGYTMYFDDVSFTAKNKAFVSGIELPDGGESDDGGNESGGSGDNGTADALATVLPVYGGANGIVTFMHDDGLYDSVIEIDKLLVKYGLVSDMALIASKATANYPTVKKWQGVLATGRWKVTSHSMTHSWWGVEPDDGDVTKVTDNVEKALSEFVESQKLLQETFPGQRVLTFAYPRFSSIYNKYIYTDGEVDEEKLLTYMDSAYIRGLVEQYYVAGRVGSGYVSLDNASSVDWEYMPGTHVVNNVSTVLGLIDDAAANGNFCLLYTHGVVYAEDGVYVSNATPTWQLDRIFQRITELVDAGLIWNTHYEDAVMYIREAESASVTISGDESCYTVILTDMMDDSIYNHALTVKIKAAESWQAVKIVQGETVSYATVVEKNGERYVFANIVPDAGEATVTPISPSEIPEQEEQEVVPTPTPESVATFENGFHTEFVENVFYTKDGMAVDPEVTDISDSADYSSMSLASDPKDAANRVLRIVNKSNSAGNGTKTTVYPSSEDSDGFCYVFETRLYLDDLTGGSADNTIMSINFTLSGTTSNVLSIVLKHTSDSTKAKLSWNNGADYTGSGDIQNSDGDILTLDIDTWYNFKVEFYQTMDAETTRCKIYLTPDGTEQTLVADEIAYSYWGLSKAPAFVRIGYPRWKARYAVCLDDISYMQISKDAGELPEQDTPTEEQERVATFDTGNIATPYVESYLYTADGTLKSVSDVTDMDAQELMRYYIADDPTDAANKCLKAQVVKGQKNVAQSYTGVTVSNENPSGSCYAFETKIYVESALTGYGLVQIAFMNSNGSTLTLHLQRNSDGTLEIISAGTYAKPSGVKLAEGIDVGSWFTLRAEYYHNGSAATTSDTYLKLYIGDTLAYDGIAYYSGSNLKSEITHVNIGHYRNGASVIYFDDISLSRTDEVYLQTVAE